MVKDPPLSLGYLCQAMRNVVEQLEKPPEEIDWVMVREEMAFATHLFESVNDEVTDCDGR